jgi:hypothetical protein
MILDDFVRIRLKKDGMTEILKMLNTQQQQQQATQQQQNIKATVINDIMFFEGREAAENIAKKEAKLILIVTIKRDIVGKYTLEIDVLNTYDRYTTKIFKYDFDSYKYFVREVLESNENYYYEDCEHEESYMKKKFNSYEEAFKEMLNILHKLKENREKVRKNKKEFFAYAII